MYVNFKIVSESILRSLRDSRVEICFNIKYTKYRYTSDILKLYLFYVIQKKATFVHIKYRQRRLRFRPALITPLSTAMSKLD